MGHAKELLHMHSDGRSNGALQERESSSADLFRWAREKILILLLRVVVLLSEKGRDSRSDGQMDLTRGARSAKGGRGRGHVGLVQLVVDGRDKCISKPKSRHLALPILPFLFL